MMDMTWKEPGTIWRYGLALLISLVLGFVLYLTNAQAATLFSDDFNDGNDAGWTPESGDWSVVSGQYRQTIKNSGFRSTITGTQYGNFEINLKYQIVDNGGSALNWTGVLLRKTNESDPFPYSGYTVRVDYNGKVSLYATATEIASYNTGDTQGAQRSLRIVMDDSNIQVYYNGGSTPIIDESDATYAYGYISINKRLRIPVSVQRLPPPDLAISNSITTIKLRITADRTITGRVCCCARRMNPTPTRSAGIRSE